MREEVDEIIHWFTGHSLGELEVQLEEQTDFETFFAEILQMNSSSFLSQYLRAPTFIPLSISQAICGKLLALKSFTRLVQIFLVSNKKHFHN